MTFLYPLGLLGLIGIPILIIIYIIKNKYTEQTIASTYLWILSEKFLKRKNPIKKLVGLISLILQILTVAALSLAMAHPIIILPDAAHEYCFILDASGSMNMVNGETTRFEKGKEKIAQIIEDSLDGSYYSLVCVSDYTTVVYERVEDKEFAIEELLTVEEGYSVGDMDDAIAKAQEYFNLNPSLKTYLITDKAYEDAVNVEVINVSGEENNYAVTELAHELKGSALTVTGKVVSYKKDMELTVELYVDDAQSPVVTQTVQTPKLALTPFTLNATLAETGFEHLTVKIVEQDDFILDNSCILFNVKNENSYQTLLVSDAPFYVSSAISAVGNAKLTVWSQEEYVSAYESGKASGFGLYIFDSVIPKELPKDGAVWFFNLNGNVENSGFTVQTEVEVGGGAKVEMSSSSATLVKNLTENVIANDFYVSSYVKYGTYRNFTTLFSYKGNPIIFTGNNDYGNREVVFAFDLHKTNASVGAMFTTLVKNLLDYSFPTVIEKVLYSVGDKLEVNVLANSTGLKITTPSNEEVYMDSNVAISEYVLEEVGVYQITMTVGGTDRYFYVYSSVPEQERAPVATASKVEVVGEPGGGGLDGKFDTLIILFISVALLFIADWGVYCYDKYQLR